MVCDNKEDDKPGAKFKFISLKFDSQSASPKSERTKTNRSISIECRDKKSSNNVFTISFAILNDLFSACPYCYSIYLFLVDCLYFPTTKVFQFEFICFLPSMQVRNKKQQQQQTTTCGRLIVARNLLL